MESCIVWQRTTCATSEKITRFSQPRWCMKPTFASSIGSEANWQNKAHFFGVAAQVMRTILTDHARHHCRIKRGGLHQHKLSLDDVQLFSEERSDDCLLSTNRFIGSLNWMRVRVGLSSFEYLAG